MRLPIRPSWLLWLCGLFCLIAICVFPVSTRLTRATGLVLVCSLWIGALVLLWRKVPARVVLLAITSAAVGFLLLPDREFPKADVLRTDYLTALQRYEGTRYIWGGENSRGIDCSGLVRRSWIEALLTRGVLDFNPTLARKGLSLWWNDCTAAALGRATPGLTEAVTETPSLNALDHRGIERGDLATTSNGVHVLAYLGDEVWIEADPVMKRVIRINARTSDSVWLHSPVKVVRWSGLASP
jgi:hypothetical protein